MKNMQQRDALFTEAQTSQCAIIVHTYLPLESNSLPLNSHKQSEH